MKQLICMAVLFLSAPAFAADAPAKPDVVDLMKVEYSDYFKELPPLRKCTIEDVGNAWEETAIYESTSHAEFDAQKAQGPKYLAFGEYNTLFWQRTRTSENAALLREKARAGSMQYIATAAGMLYVYDKGALQESLMCFISTEDTKKFTKDMLVLARPIEKDKSLTVTLYKPLK
ncbi:MAG: hypothetical protein SFX19_05730 [Alphaproteobacteria bacterium]|nr:hypothetical protein [Alphaproteobacteria bacterium]